MIHRALVILALACSAFVIASFTLFARDQLAGASKHQQTELAVGNPAQPTAVPVHHAKGQPRRFIDDAANKLTAPFDSVVNSSDQWVNHGLPAILALLVYGVGIGYLARFSQGLP